MRTPLRQLCAVSVLTVVLSVSALAGDIGVGRSSYAAGDIGVGKSATAAGDIGVGRSSYAAGDIGVGRQLLYLIGSVLTSIRY